VVAATRFVKINKDIASQDVKSVEGARIDIALAILLVLLGLGLMIYLSHAIITNT